MQRFDTITRRRHHAFDLMILPLGHRQAQQASRNALASGGRDRRRFIVQDDAIKQRVDALWAELGID